MDEATVARFLEAILPVVLDAGEFAVQAQVNVQNIGKAADEESQSTPVEFVKLREQAKTIVDEQVQEKILLAVYSAFGEKFARIDGEEDTPSKGFFTQADSDITLVIDPIDGTLQYLKGSKDYSVNIALVSKGEVLCAVQYFPAYGRLYLLDEEKSAFVCIYEKQNLMRVDRLQPPATVKTETIYVNHRVPNQECLANTYAVVKDADGIVLWTDAFFKCTSGEYAAVLLFRPQIRDMLLGSMIAAMPGGYAVDFAGNPIKWPDGGRIQEVIFGFGELPADIKACFA